MNNNQIGRFYYDVKKIKEIATTIREEDFDLFLENGKTADQILRIS